MAEAMNKELKQLVEAGCSVIQIEEPTLHFLARYYPEETETIDFLVDCFNREIEGLDDAEVWIHTCWGNEHAEGLLRRVVRELDRDLPRAPEGDVWTIEATENDLKEIELFGPYKDSLKKKVAVGRRQPPDAPGRHAATGRRPDPARARAHPGGQARALDRLRLRPAGLQPSRRVLQDDGDPAGAEHRARGARGWSRDMSPQPTRASSGTGCPTTSRTRISARFAEPAW